MKVIDNFLPQAYQDAIENVMLDFDFPWYLNKNTVDNYGSTYIARESTTEAPQFTHRFFYDGAVKSEYFNLVSLITYHLMLTENIDTTSLIRMKANLNTPIVGYPKDNHYGVHRDYPERSDYITGIYYVNDSDGDTKFFDDTGNVISSISPKKGRLVYFDGNTQHAGCPPSAHTTRCVINFNFIAKETK